MLKRSSMGCGVAQRESDELDSAPASWKGGPSSILGSASMEVHLTKRTVDARSMQEGKWFRMNEFVIVLLKLMF